MVPTLSPSLVVMDLLCCMGLGFFAACLRLALPLWGQVGRFVADFLLTLLALLLTQAYAAQSSNAGVLRFYMVAALALGAFACVQVFAAYAAFVVGVAQCLFAVPLRILFHKLVAPAFLYAKRCHIEKKERRKAAAAQKTLQKQLQSKGVLLYNSNMD